MKSDLKRKEKKEPGPSINRVFEIWWVFECIS